MEYRVLCRAWQSLAPFPTVDTQLAMLLALMHCAASKPPGHSISCIMGESRLHTRFAIAGDEILFLPLSVPSAGAPPHSPGKLQSGAVRQRPR